MEVVYYNTTHGLVGKIHAFSFWVADSLCFKSCKIYTKATLFDITEISVLLVQASYTF